MSDEGEPRPDPGLDSGPQDAAETAAPAADVAAPASEPTPEPGADPDAAEPAAAEAAPAVAEGPRVEATIFIAGLPEAVRQHLLRDDCTAVEDLDAIGQADVVVVSTRLPRAQCQELVNRVRGLTEKPIIALTHAGGEAAAVEIMRAGGSAVVAEGNEAALRRMLAGDVGPGTLTETYDAHMGKRRARDVGGRGRDTVTNLPTGSAFEARLREMDQVDHVEEPVRIGFLRVLNFEHTARRLAAEATGILRRRLGLAFAEIARAHDIELFVLGPADYAFVGRDITPARAQAFGNELTRVTEAFAPTSHGPLGLAVGHAGPELSTELTGLRDLAQRAVALAAVQEASTVIGAEELSQTLTSTTELEVALRMLHAVERDDPAGSSHGARVAQQAAEIAQHLGYEGAERATIRFAAHLHDIGKIGLPAAALYPGEDAEASERDAYRTHPERGAAYLRVSAGEEVATAVRGHHEHWDGSGFPDGLAGHDIPMPARIIAVADAWDRWAHEPISGDDLAAELVRRLREAEGVRFDPAVVEAAVELLAADERPRDVGPGSRAS